MFGLGVRLRVNINHVKYMYVPASGLTFTTCDGVTHAINSYLRYNIDNRAFEHPGSPAPIDMTDVCKTMAGADVDAAYTKARPPTIHFVFLLNLRMLMGCSEARSTPPASSRDGSPPASSRVGSKLLLPIYADVQHSDGA